MTTLISLLERQKQQKVWARSECIWLSLYKHWLSLFKPKWSCRCSPTTFEPSKIERTNLINIQTFWHLPGTIQLKSFVVFGQHFRFPLFDGLFVAHTLTRSHSTAHEKFQVFRVDWKRRRFRSHQNVTHVCSVRLLSLSGLLLFQWTLRGSMEAIDVVYNSMSARAVWTFDSVVHSSSLIWFEYPLFAVLVRLWLRFVSGKGVHSLNVESGEVFLVCVSFYHCWLIELMLLMLLQCIIQVTDVALLMLPVVVVGVFVIIVFLVALELLLIIPFFRGEVIDSHGSDGWKLVSVAK